MGPNPGDQQGPPQGLARRALPWLALAALLLAVATLFDLTTAALASGWDDSDGWQPPSQPLRRLDADLLLSYDVDDEGLAATYKMTLARDNPLVDDVDVMGTKAASTLGDYLGALTIDGKRI